MKIIEFLASRKIASKFFYLKKEKNKIFDILIPIVLFGVAFTWKFFHIDARDICLDEPFTIFNAQDSILNILKLPTKNEPSPPLFMLVLHFWINIFGISAQSVRVVPIFFNALTAVFLYLTGKRFFSFWSGLTAAALFIFSTYHFFYGADTRTYSMLSFATAMSLYYLIAIRKNPEKRFYLFALIVSNLILVYGHYFGWFVIFMQFIVGFFYFKNKPAFKKILIAVFLTAIFYFPMFSILIKQFFISKESTWVVPPHGSEYIEQLRSFLNSDLGLKFVFGSLIIGIIVAIITKQKKENLKDLIVLLIWWIVPYSLMFVVSSKIPMFNSRYILFNSIGLYLFIGVALSFFYQKIKFLVPVVCIALIVIMYTRIYTEDFAPRKVKKSIEFVRNNTDSNTSIIIYPHWADLGFMYYFDQEIFKSVGEYANLLKENNIYQAWGLQDTKEFLEKNKSRQIILFENNTPEIDPGNSVFLYTDSILVKKDSAVFQGGFVVSIFNSAESSIAEE